MERSLFYHLPKKGRIMKKHQLFIFSVCALSTLVFSCNREQPKQAVVEKKMACFRSVSLGDTAWLSIDTAQKTIKGTLRVNYVNKMEIYDGRFTGKMYGDTLKGHYDFKINKADPAFRNPLAFLKRDKKLTMGVGKFMTVMGSAQFDDRVPIDYGKGRFVFEEADCN